MDELQRLDTLHRLKILDTPADPVFDDVTRVLCKEFDVPISLISLVDRQRQWFKSRQGFDVCETSRDISFCKFVVSGEKTLIVNDALLDERFLKNPLVVGEPKIRFYAGAPLKTSDGAIIGTLCVMDRRPREFSEDKIQLLNVMAQLVMNQIESVQVNEVLKSVISQVEDSERQLGVTALRLESLIDNQNLGVIFLDKDGTVSFKNQFLEKIFPQIPRESTGVTCDEFCEVISDLFMDKEYICEQLKRIMAIQEVRLNFPIALKDGRYLECDYIPINEGDLRYGQTWIFRDVTEKNETEKTLQLQRMKLIEASKLKALGEMAGGVAHEINNPLTVILGRVMQLKELAENNTLDPETVIKYTTQVVTVVNRIVRIIKGLRAFSRDGEKDPIENVNLPDLLNETLEFCNYKIRGLNAEVVIENVSLDPYAHVRKIPLSQVILNLLNNSCDAIQNVSERWIRARIYGDDKNLCLSITDSGQPMPSSVSEKLFQPFFTTKSSGSGTGLGLSISKKILQSFDGDLYFDKQNPNTCFVIVLKRAVNSK